MGKSSLAGGRWGPLRSSGGTILLWRQSWQRCAPGEANQLMAWEGRTAAGVVRSEEGGTVIELVGSLAS